MAETCLVEHNDGCVETLAVRVRHALGVATRGLIIDLVNGPVDAVVVHLLVVTDKTLLARGGRLVVLCHEGPGRAALRVSGIDAHLSVAQGLQQALAIISAPR